MDKELERRQWQQATRVLWYGGWFDVALGIAALLWWDKFFPSPMPIVFGLSVGTITGLALLLFAAPAIFALYYFRRKQEVGNIPLPRATRREALNADFFRSPVTRFNMDDKIRKRILAFYFAGFLNCDAGVVSCCSTAGPGRTGHVVPPAGFSSVSLWWTSGLRAP